MLRSGTRIASIMVDPLIDVSPETGELVPALATQWVVTDDSKHWTFTLREDIWFHDGTKFNASAVKFTYERIFDPAHPAYVSESIYDYSELPWESVEILDEYKVTIHFNKSYSSFAYGIASLWGIYSINSFKGGSNITTAYGTGPYYLDLVNSNATFLRFLRNDQHFRGFPPFEEIHYIPYAYYLDLESDVEANKADFTTFAHYREENETPFNDDYWEYHEGQSALEVGIINHLRPELVNPLVRKAINYAINREQYIDDMKLDTVIKGVRPMNSIIAFDAPVYQESIEGYPYNVNMANNLLDEAGYPRGGDGYRFNLTLNSYSHLIYKLDLISSYLDEIGIRCFLPVNGNESFAKLEQGDFDIFIVHAWHGGSAFLFSTLHSSSSSNFGNYNNTLMDFYLEVGIQSPVRQVREYFYHKIQRLAQIDPPYLLLQTGYLVSMRAKHVGPYIGVNLDGRIVFNYSTVFQDDDIYHMKDVHVSEYPIYFPFTDGLVALEDQQIESNMTMTHQLRNLLPYQRETGKFFEFQINNSELEYNLRCYYDFDEMHQSNAFEEQGIFRWNYSTQSWNKLEVVASNTSLRFSEIKLKGNVILRLGKVDLLLLTFRYLPIIILIIGPIIVLGGLITIKNRNIRKKLKKEYDLF
jgi:peptide/nickel transport system substrate-binding protein